MGNGHDPVDSHAQTHLWGSLAVPVDLLALRGALTAGADANAVCHHPEMTPLEAAVEVGSLPACILLVEHGARVDARAIDDGRSLLHRAISALSDEAVRHPIVDFLIASGASVEALTDQGQSVLDWAQMWGDEILVRRLRTDLPSDTV